MDIKDFKYVLCPGSMPEDKYEDMYNQIYQCWRDVWIDAFRELKVEKSLHSDAFTRQDYVGALFYRNQCFALAFYRWAEAKRQEFEQDSYFSNWGAEHLEKLCSRGPNIIICSQFTVHQRGRGKTLGISGKELLAGMAVQTFINSEADGMTGAVRVDKGVNGAGLRWGAYSIESRVPCEFGENNTELIGFFKDFILRQPKHELSEVAEALWRDRLIISRKNLKDQFLKDPTQIKLAA